MKYVLLSLTVSLTTVLTACGGGGGGSGGANNNPPAPPPPAQTDFQAGIFSNDSIYENMCLTPRSGSNDTQGTTADENNWLRAWSHDLYLWYNEIADADPVGHTTPDYFDLMKMIEKADK
jgi:carboxyl-terminal processing protease